MNVFSREDLGVDIAALGAVITCIGVVFNSILLDHVAAMQVWMISNPIMLIWSFGLWRRWWDGGLSGLVLMVMYLIFTVSNLYGLIK